MTTWLLRIVAITLIANLLTSCLGSDQGGPPAFELTNQTDQDVAVFLLYPDGTERRQPLVSDLRPGTTASLQDTFSPNKCSAGTLIARTLAGDEVARRSDPICTPGVWMIGAPQPSWPALGPDVKGQEAEALLEISTRLPSGSRT